MITLGSLRATFEDLLGTKDVDRWAGLIRYHPLRLGAGLAGATVSSFPGEDLASVRLAARERVKYRLPHGESVYTGF